MRSVACGAPGSKRLVVHPAVARLLEERPDWLEALARQVTAPGTGSLSAGFLSAYAGLVNDELLKIAQSPDTRVRLNVAIVSARVAEGAKNAKLAPLTAALLKDASDGVLWWALRSARAVIPYDNTNQLIPVIVELGRTRPGVITAVYDALAVPQGTGANAAKVLAIAPRTLLIKRYLRTGNSDDAD